MEVVEGAYAAKMALYRILLRMENISIISFLLSVSGLVGGYELMLVFVELPSVHLLSSGSPTLLIFKPIQS